jgi:hypothetical protein
VDIKIKFNLQIYIFILSFLQLKNKKLMLYKNRRLCYNDFGQKTGGNMFSEKKSHLSAAVERRIVAYRPKGGLDHTARLFLAICSINHPRVKEHAERVALLAENTALALEKDLKAAFFAGLLHDFGKIMLPPELFQEKVKISERDFAHIKTHAVSAFRVLQPFHPFIALCAGLHHALYKMGYGLTLKDLPEEWSLATAKKVLDISTIISVCDFIDAATHRKTKLRGTKAEKKSTLRQLLLEKYPDDRLVVRAALKAKR